MNPPAWLRRAALLVYALGVLAYREALMDDTYIHLQYARNLRSFGELAFNHGQPSLGASSPLWMLLLAAVGPSETAARLLSVGCGALAVLVFAALAYRVVGGAWAAAATLAWAGTLWLVRHAPNGMESTAAALLVLLAVDLRARGARGTAADVGFGLALAGAWLLRPETLLLAVLFALADLRTAPGRARFASWWPAAVLPVLAWLWFAHARTGHVLPGTGAAKSGGFAAAPLVWLRVLRRTFEMLLLGHAVELLGLVLALVLALRLDGRRALQHVRQHALLPYGLFALALVLAYAAADVQVQPRYLLPVMPCLVLAGFGAWRAVLGRSARAAAAVCIASLVLGAAVGAWRVHGATRDFARGLREVLVPMALEVAQHHVPGASVASPDIGVMGWYGGAHVLDLGGLIEPRVQALVRRHGYDAVLERGLFLDIEPVQFVLDRSPERERFRDHMTRGLLWRPLRTGVVHGLGISRPQDVWYTLYALEPQTAIGDAGVRGTTGGSAVLAARNETNSDGDEHDRASRPR